MSLKITKPLVTVDWLYKHINDTNLVVLDCTIPKVTDVATTGIAKKCIKGALFFDLKKTFSDQNATLPNTVLTAEVFERKAQELGINNNSVIICYDDLGIYSAPRVWWMFQLMGFQNIAVLDGGLPEWNANNYPTVANYSIKSDKGNFTVDFKPNKLKNTAAVYKAMSSDTSVIIDARSEERFLGTAPEPRPELSSGHIPNSINIPFKFVLENKKMKSYDDLFKIFTKFEIENKIIFTCGSGITASILALAAAVLEIKNTAVYDGSWTEWASNGNLPIVKEV